MNNRLPHGGEALDRARPLQFRFDGKTYRGFAGDSLASALLAAAPRTLARSFKYHRPRGLVAAGEEEPNCLVTLGEGAAAIPNLRATEVMLQEGLVARSQNCWPGPGFDLGAASGLFARFLQAGFYYKTFLWPAGGWKFYERFIRRAAGLGPPPEGPDPRRHETRHGHADFLVIGGGPAGLTAALAAARDGANVVLAESKAALGGALLVETAEIEGLANLRILTRTTAVACHDQGYVLLEESLPEGQRLWKLRAKKILLATGALERPLVFPGNDRPGIMLAGAVRSYIRRHAVRPGRRAVVFTNNDSTHGLLNDLRAADIEIAAVVDLRLEASNEAPFYGGAHIAATHGRKALSAVEIVTAEGARLSVDCDLLCMSGGWTPSLQLYAQAGGKLIFDPDLGAFRPGDPDRPLEVIGAAAGNFAPADALVPPEALRGAWQKAFVDFQNDVTFDDLRLAVAEGYRDIELVKRYTTTGMGTDQGKTANVNALAYLAQLTGRPVGELGHTTFRPPYTPITFGAIAAERLGKQLAATRRTPFHAAGVAEGAVFVEAGNWLYPRYYPLVGEDMAAAIDREVRNTRAAVGMVDMSSLGKVEIQGRDAPTFLERVYCNNLAKLGIGRCRYALMLREDGVLFDDGTVSRLGEAHYLITMTTANAGTAWLQLEHFRQACWPELDLRMASVTDHWASLAIAGPRARDLLAALAPDFEAGAAAFPFMSLREGRVAGLPARVFRVSFSGELGYEINVPAGFATALWRRCRTAGEPLGLMPYGLEALDILRIEKGHISVGTEIDGRATAEDLGLGRMVSQAKDFIGGRLKDRPALIAPGRHQLIGLVPADGQSEIPVGAMLVEGARGAAALGHLTAAIFSPSLGHAIALAMLADGRQRIGQELWATAPVAGKACAVTVVSPHHFDPEGARLRV